MPLPEFRRYPGPVRNKQNRLVAAWNAQQLSAFLDQKQFTIFENLYILLVNHYFTQRTFFLWKDRLLVSDAKAEELGEHFQGHKNAALAREAIRWGEQSGHKQDGWCWFQRLISIHISNSLQNPSTTAPTNPQASRQLISEESSRFRGEELFGLLSYR